MHLLLALLLTFAWDADPNYPAGITYELEANGVTAAGIEATQHTLDVPGAPGDPLDVRVRAVAPDGRLSEWTELNTVIPGGGDPTVPLAATEATIVPLIYKEVPWAVKPPFGQAVVDWPHPINRGLLGWWITNEGAGETLYDLAEKSNGTLTNMALPDSWQSTQFGPALDYDGTNDHVSIPSGPIGLASATQLTVSAWVKNDIGSGAGTDDIVAWWEFVDDQTPTPRAFVMTHHNNDQFFFEVRQNAGTSTTVTGGTVDTNWHFIVATWVAGTSVTLYVDGIQVATSGTSVDALWDLGTSKPLTIGSQVDLTNLFDGLITNVRLLNRAWNAQEVKDVYDSQGLLGLVPQRRYFPIPDEAAATTIDVNRGLLLLNGRSPAFSADRIIQPDQGLFALNGRSPAFNVDARLLQPNQGLFALNGAAVNFDARALIRVDQGLFALNGRSPAFNVDARLLQPNQGLLLLNSGEPVVNADERLILPDHGLLLFKGYVPDFTTGAGVTLQVDRGLLLLNGGAVAFNIDERLLKPGQGLLLFGGNAPAFVTQRDLAVDRGLLLFKGAAPDFTRIRGLFVDRGGLSFVGGAPDFTRATRITVERGLLLLNGQPIDSFLGGVTVVEPAAGQLLFQGGSIGGSAMIWTETDEVSGTWSAVQTAAGTWILIRGRDA